MENPTLRLEKLKVIKVLGKGAMGTVFLVDDVGTPMALKVVEKSNPSAARRARWESSLLSRLRHPFLPTLLGSSETEEFLCWATPYCPGRDLNLLRHTLCPDRAFSPSAIRFYAAELILALHHLHSLGLAYRDLKPENILVQLSGHVTLTDFDLSRPLNPTTEDTIPPFQHQNKSRKPKTARVSPVSRSYERANSFVGTEEYVAPEVVRGEGHGFAVDWWALGVLSYEMLYGTTPFKGKNRKDTFRRILMVEPEFVGRRDSLTDFIAKLLVKDPTRRLGYRGGACEIKEHEFFRGMRWDLLTEVSRPPFLPSCDDTERVTGGGVSVLEYYKKLQAPPSPLWSPSHESNVSLPEF